MAVGDFSTCGYCPKKYPSFCEIIFLLKDFTNLGQRDFIKKLSNDNYVYILYQRVKSAIFHCVRAGGWMLSFFWTTIFSTPLNRLK